MTELKPCPFCGAGEHRYEEHNHWTGQRNVLVSVTLRHWCDGEEPRPTTITITRKTKEECAAAWNNRV